MIDISKGRYWDNAALTGAEGVRADMPGCVMV
jgi:hypothetical protein